MAIVRKIEPNPKGGHKPQKDADCLFKVDSDEHGKFLQLDTTGSPDKETKGAVSQSLRFHEQAASRLKQLIEETFPKLR
jgi:hypothetical protein